MAEITILNLTSVAQRVEFLGHGGATDSHTVFARSQVQIDEEVLLTSKQELTKRGLKLIKKSSAPIVEVASHVQPEPATATQTQPQQNNNNNNKNKQQQG